MQIMHGVPTMVAVASLYRVSFEATTQVSQLEAGMLILTILVALGFGTWCLGILDTPTRFATPKEHDR